MFHRCEPMIWTAIAIFIRNVTPRNARPLDRFPPRRKRIGEGGDMQVQIEDCKGRDKPEKGESVEVREPLVCSAHDCLGIREIFGEEHVAQIPVRTPPSTAKNK